MNQEHEDETTQPRDVSPSCKCFVTADSVPCPVHGLDRSQTTKHPSRVQSQHRVVNTTDSLKR